MRKSTLFTTLLVLALSLILSISVMAQDDVTLRVLQHQNPATVEFMEQFNADFEAANPVSLLRWLLLLPATSPQSPRHV